MLKVICINEKWIRPAKHQDLKGPVFLEECEVVKSFNIPGEIVAGECFGGVYYQLAGYGKTGYHADNFATLPCESAEQMSESEREAIVNIENQIV